jgi:hypothetical protein
VVVAPLVVEAVVVETPGLAPSFDEQAAATMTTGSKLPVTQRCMLRA